jgi:hypothetical protein
MLVALAACRAEADPGSGITAPAGWRTMPELATAVRTAAVDVTVSGSEAWGEPAMGCYATWLAVHAGGAAPDAMAQQLLDRIAAEKIEVRDVVKPTAGAETGTLSFGLARAPYHGRVRAELDRDGRVTALVCFWNQREPHACETACAALIGSAR